MKVIIYGKGGCPNCVNAKNLCEQKGISVDYKTVGQDITKEQLEEKIGFPIRTVPQIFIYSDGFAEYVGGFAELKSRLQ